MEVRPRRWLDWLALRSTLYIGSLGTLHVPGLPAELHLLRTRLLHLRRAGSAGRPLIKLTELALLPVAVLRETFVGHPARAHTCQALPSWVYARLAVSLFGVRGDLLEHLHNVAFAIFCLLRGLDQGLRSFNDLHIAMLKLGSACEGIPLLVVSGGSSKVRREPLLDLVSVDTCPADEVARLHDLWRQVLWVKSLLEFSYFGMHLGCQKLCLL